jgi:hypothetical protein
VNLVARLYSPTFTQFFFIESISRENHESKCIALSFALVLVGCSTTTLKAPADYPKLSVKADESNTLVFAKPDLRLGQYSKAYIAPVLVQIGNDQVFWTFPTTSRRSWLAMLRIA